MGSQTRPIIVTVAAVGSLLLGFCCCGQGGAVMATPVIVQWQKKTMNALMEPERARLAKERQDLERQRTETTDQQVIAAIDQRIAQLDRQAPPDMNAFFEGLASPQATRCYLFEGLSAAIMNLLVFIAGFGLLAMKPWARRLAIYAAIGRLVTAAVYFVLVLTVVMPAMAEGMRKFQESIANMPAGAGGPPMPDMGPMMAVQGTVGAVFALLIAAAWPLALLIMLNTRAAREALAPGAAIAPAPDDGAAPGGARS